MVGGRAIGVHLHARCSCDGQAQRRAALAVEMRVSDRGSGRSGAIDEAADIAISDQPSVTVTIQLFTQLAILQLVHRKCSAIFLFIFSDRAIVGARQGR